MAEFTLTQEPVEQGLKKLDFLSKADNRDHSDWMSVNKNKSVTEKRERSPESFRLSLTGWSPLISFLSE